MLKFIYDRYDFKRRKPYPNLFDKAIISYYNQHSDEYNYDINNQKFVLATCHSELYGNVIAKSKNYIIAQDGVPSNDEKQFYPIEVFGNHRRLLDGNDYKNLNDSSNPLTKLDNPSRGFVNETSLMKPDNYTFLTENVELDHLKIAVKVPTLQSLGSLGPIKQSLIANLHIHSKQLYQFSSIFDIRTIFQNFSTFCST